jgi:hypothetical protein
LYVSVDTEKLEFLDFNVQVVPKLTLFAEEVSVVSVVESQLVFSQWSAEICFKPVSVSFVTEGLGFDFQDFSASQQEEFSWVVLEIGDVPNSWNDQSWGSIQTEAAPIPSKFEWIEYVVQDTQWDE